MKSRYNQNFIHFALVLISATLLAACGQGSSGDSNSKIVGGVEAEASDIVTRSTVALVNSQGRSFCTGSLITRIHVLTAAHCLVNYGSERLYVAFGPKATLENLSRSRLRRANFYKPHQDFSRAAMQNFNLPKIPSDIALVQLSQPAPSAFRPVRLLSENSDLYRGEALLLAGFGITDYQQRDSGVLRKVTTKLGQIIKSKKELIYRTTKDKGACRGDSGGPAFVRRGQSLRLVGVTSRGPRVCGATGIYTDARLFKGWIRDTVREALKVFQTGDGR